MNGKELWASKLALREQSWKSKTTGAEFIIRQPDSGETIQLVALNVELQKDPSKLKDVLLHVWTHYVLEPQSRQPAFTMGDEAIIMRGDFAELLDVMNTVIGMIPSTDKASIELMRKNSKTTRRR